MLNSSARSLHIDLRYRRPHFNALEAVHRQRFGVLQADLNYTYSESLDITSQADRLGNSATTNYAQIMNWSGAKPA